MISLQQLKCFILDMDGTIYLGNHVIPGSKILLDLFEERNVPYYFFTNNSSKSPNNYIEKLIRLGFGTYSRDRIITSGDVTADYILKTFGEKAKVYVVGTDSLISHFESWGITCVEDDLPDCIVVGFDTSYHFGKASRAVDLLGENIPFLATNIDAVCPLENNMVLPDCSSICAMLTHATGKKPKYLGKPFAETAQYIQKITGVSANETAVVGDRLYTDMHLALNNDMCAIGVLSGEMTQKDIENSNLKPHYVFDSAKCLADALIG